MEDGNKSKKTIFVGGLGEDIDENIVYEHFVTFGDIIDVKLPLATQNSRDDKEKHRGFAFVTYSSPADAADAIDNMDMNELRSYVLKVNLAKPTKATMEGAGNRAVWETEEWLKQHAKPLAKSGGVQGRNAKPSAEDEADEADEAGDANDGDEPMEE